MQGEYNGKNFREIRQAYGINLISTSNLKLNTKDSVGVNKTIEFSLTGSNIRLWIMMFLQPI